MTVPKLHFQRAYTQQPVTPIDNPYTNTNFPIGKSFSLIINGMPNPLSRDHLSFIHLWLAKQAFANEYAYPGHPPGTVLW